MPTNRTQYQDEIVQSNRNTIMIGSRQSGKTETVVQCAADAFRSNERVLCLAPQQRMSELISEQLQDEFTNQICRRDEIRSRTTYGSILFRSSYAMSYDNLPTDRTHLLLIDEANYVSQELLFDIEQQFDGRVVLTATPSPKRTVVELWAEHSPYWNKVHVPASKAPYLDANNIADYQEHLETERKLCEIDAKIL